MAALLKQEVRRSGDSVTMTVNRVLRTGLMAVRQQRELEPFVVTPFDIGLPSGVNFDCTEEVLDALEGPMHR